MVRFGKKGGAFLGKGTYGCVLTPPASCSGKVPSGRVAKIFENNLDAEAEWRNADRLNKIDPDGVHTNPMVDACALSVDDIDPRDYESCKLEPGSSLSQLVYKNEGINLFAYMNRNKINPYTVEFVTMLHELAKGIVLFAKNGLKHNDIKEENVLVINEGTKYRAVFIDYGMVEEVDRFYRVSKPIALNARYYAFPPEYMLWYNIFTDANNTTRVVPLKMRQNAIQAALNYTTLYFRILKLHDSIAQLPYVHSKISFLQQIRNFATVVSQVHASNVQRIFDSIVTRSDVYQFGLMMGRIVHSFGGDVNDNTEMINDIILRCTSGNPLERPTPDELVNLLNPKRFSSSLKSHALKNASLIGMRPRTNVTRVDAFQNSVRAHPLSDSKLQNIRRKAMNVMNRSKAALMKTA